jgi:hypothetical protein
MNCLKQTQTNPNRTQFLWHQQGRLQKQTQSKPILSACAADKIVPSAVEGPIKTTPGLAGLNQQATRDERPATKQRFVLTFAGNFLKYGGYGSVAQAVEQRTFNA